MDAGVGGFEEAQNTPCAVFYGAGCALFQDLFTDLVSLGAPPSPPPPPFPDIASFSILAPTRILFAMGPSPNMVAASQQAAGESGTIGEVGPGLRRRSLQSQDADGESMEIIDASTDHGIISACSQAEDGSKLSLCETNGYENAVRLKRFQTRLYYTPVYHADNCACHRSGSCSTSERRKRYARFSSRCTSLQSRHRPRHHRLHRRCLHLQIRRRHCHRSHRYHQLRHPHTFPSSALGRLERRTATTNSLCAQTTAFAKMVARAARRTCAP